MKVLILSPKNPYPPIDGGAIATLNLAMGLAGYGLEVTLLSLNTLKHYFPTENIPEKIKEKIKYITINADTSIIPLKAVSNLLFSSKPYISERFYLPEFAAFLVTELKKNKYDIIQLEGPYMSVYLPLIRKHSEAKISLRAHNIEHEIWKSRSRNDKFLPRKLYYRNLAERIRKLETKLLYQIDILVAISENDRLSLVKFRPDILSITVPTGIEIADYNPSYNKESSDLFFIGSLDWGPNQEGLLWFIRKVLPHILKNIPETKVYIAGRNAPDSFSKSLQHPSVIYDGEVNNAKEYMTNHGIMIVPLLSGSGIRIKILEGMAMGKCIITTSIGAEGLPVENMKHLVIEDNPEQFAEKTIKLLQNIDIKDRIGINSRQLIQEKFDTFAVTSRLGDLYTKNK